MLTGEPCAGNPPARFGGRGGANQCAAPTPILRLVKMLTVNQTAYQGQAARQSNASKEIRAQDAEQTWKILLQKWKTIPNYQEVVFAEDKPLGMWRRLMIELYESNLPLPRKK